MKHNPHGHNCHGVDAAIFMQMATRHRWEEIGDFFPESTDLPPRIPRPAWRALALAYFIPQKRPPGFINPSYCQHPRWITGTPGRWVCPRCGSVTLKKPIPGHHVVLEEDQIRRQARKRLEDDLDQWKYTPPPQPTVESSLWSAAALRSIAPPNSKPRPRLDPDYYDAWWRPVHKEPLFDPHGVLDAHGNLPP